MIYENLTFNTSELFTMYPERHNNDFENVSLKYITTDVIRNLTSSNMTNVTDDTVQEMISTYLGARRKDMFSVMILTVLYVIIFLTGTIGNTTTCFVILKHKYMHTVTNQYLFNLALSDLLILLLGKSNYLILCCNLALSFLLITHK